MKDIILKKCIFVMLSLFLFGSCLSQDSTSFITTWRTTYIDEEITIPTTGEGYNYNVIWGDGSFGTNYTGDASHVYAVAGDYKVSISGDFPRIYFNYNEDSDKIISVDQWGAIEWLSMERAFAGCTNIQGNANDIPDLSKVRDMSFMFSRAYSFNQNIDKWDVSKVETMKGTFETALSFNSVLTNWDVASVKDMELMFFQARDFDQNINSWDVSNVITMAYMFGISVFNQNIGDWNVSSVTNMTGMFGQCYLFNQNIGNWDVSKVENMSYMFSSCTLFNQDLSSWSVGSVIEMKEMFHSAIMFNQDIGNWEVSEVVDMHSMFKDAPVFNQYIGDWDVSKVVDMNSMFADAVSFDQNISNWDISNVQDFRGFLQEVRLRSYHYDQILINWDSLIVITNLDFDGGYSEYCLGDEARSNLINGNNWNISDGGLLCNDLCSTFPEDILCLDEVKAIMNLNEETSCVDCPYQVILGKLYGKSVILVSPPTNCNELHGALLDCEGNIICNIGGLIGDCPLGIINLVHDRDTIWDCTMIIPNCPEIIEMPFVTTWRITNQNESITIPTKGGGYNYRVSWGDGSTTSGHMTNASHEYEMPGDYQVSIQGRFPQIFFNNIGDKDKIIWIDQWGTGMWTSMTRAFEGCVNLNGRAIDQPNLSLVTDMSGMFAKAESFNQGLNSWDVSRVVNMSEMFSGAIAFNGEIDQWNTSEVTSMEAIFNSAKKFNQVIGDWDVSKVTNMSLMFGGTDEFNQDISEWNVGNVTNMEVMFGLTKRFNQPIGDWDVSKVTNMHEMFALAEVFDQDIGDWDVSLVNNMSGMFAGANKFNQDIGRWNTLELSVMTGMFLDATMFNQDIKNWDVSEIMSFDYVFLSAISFDQNLGDWDVSNSYSFLGMFGGIKLSTINYDSIFIGWNQRTLLNSCWFDGGLSQYCHGEDARQEMIERSGWKITDGGLECTNECEEIKDNILCLPKVNVLLQANANEDCRTCPYQVIVGDLDGTGVVLVTAPECCCDKSGALFLCNGSQLCTIGGISGGTCAPDIIDQMANKETIWECRDSLPECITVEVPEIMSEYNISVSPNPVLADVEIQLTMDSYHDVEIQLVDITGQVLFTQVERGRSIRIKESLITYPNGIYIVKIYVDGGFVEARKLIKL